MTQTQQLQWGILGAARVNERLLPALVESGPSRLVAIASRRPGAAAETLAKYAPELDGVAAYDRLEDLLDDSRVQAVYLPLANHEHAAWALRAIESGKHVLIEKPMALSVTDIDAIDAAARAAGVKVTEGFMYRYHPQHARVDELLRSGQIGEVRSVRASYSFMMRPARLYRLADDPARGGGALWDIGPYAIHALRAGFGREPSAVVAQAHYAASGADISASGVLDFGDGRFGHFDISFARARRSEYEITGTRGGILCHTVWQLPGTGDVPVVSWWTEDGPGATERLAVANHFNREIAHFSRAVLDGTAPLLSLDDARENCRVLVATHRAAASGTRAAVTR